MPTLPPLPYYVVIFTNTRNNNDEEGYQLTAVKMVEMAAQQNGFLGIESVRANNAEGITVSYWKDEASIRAWKQVAEHKTAQKAGRDKWYKNFITRIAKVERHYSFGGE